MAELLIRGSIGSFAFTYWDLDMVGGSRVPPGPCFLYGNHSNNFDPFLVNMFTGIGSASSGVMTMEYLESGPLATVFGWLGLEGTRKRVPEPHLIRRIYRLLDAGRRVLIYPEGGRRWDGRPANWIESTAKLFHRAGVPVYPVVTHASYVSWPRWARWPRPANVRVEVLHAIDFTGVTTTAGAIDRLARPIDFDENTVAEELRPRWAWRPADGVHRLLYRDPVTAEFAGLGSTDGTHVVGPDGRVRWRMLPDSRLRDPASGAITTTAEVYDTVRRLPLVPDTEGVLVRARGDVVRTSFDSARRTARKRVAGAADRGAAIHLRADSLQGGNHHIDFADIRYIGLERNDILWVMTDDGRLDIHVDAGGSVLAFHDSILRLAPHVNPGEDRGGA